MSILFNFTETLPTQPLDQSLSFGFISTDKCRVTSSFVIPAPSSSPNRRAYSMMKGTLLFQQQVNPDRINIILRPTSPNQFKLPVKYVIYRGLKTTDFVQLTNLTDVANEVKTSGTPLLVELQALQVARGSTDAIPVEALFGSDLAPLATKSIESFFYKKVANPERFGLFTVEGGLELGEFDAGDAGIEIVLENPEYSPNVEMAKKNVFEIDVTGITDTVEKKWKKDLIRHFVDPAAFYGLHATIEGGIGYMGTSGMESTTSIDLVATKILLPFATRDVVYLDIRNENGYSYNYYNNYVGSGVDAQKELKIGAVSGTLTTEEYYNDGWPIYKVNGIVPSTTLQVNKFFMRLRVNDNEKPLLAGRKEILINGTAPDTAQQVQFIDETSLLPIGLTPEFTNEFEINVPNRLVGMVGEQIATIVKLDYIKQVRPNDGTDAFPQDTGLDHVFGPITAEIPWDSSDDTKWMGTHHLKYYDGLSQGYAIGTLEIDIESVSPALRSITLVSEVKEPISEIVKITNTGTSSIKGDYTVLNVGLTAAKTVVTVHENIPGLFSTGDKLKIETEILVFIDRKESKLFARGVDLTTSPQYQVGKKVRMYGIYSSNAVTRYEISSLTVVSGDTIMAFTPEINALGFGAIMETGIVSETDVNIGGTGDNDNVIFYSVPRYYLQNRAVQNTTFFNYRGGTNNGGTFADTIKALAPNFNIGKTTLHPTVGTSDVLAVTSYPKDAKIKENIHFLGIKKNEFDILLTAANAQLSPYHIKMCKLIPQLEPGSTEPRYRFRDQDFEPYYVYHLVISGLNSAGNYHETTTFIEVFSRDGLIFSSRNYAQIGLVPDATYDTLLDQLLDINYTSRVFMINELTSSLHRDGRLPLVRNKEQKQIDDWKMGVSDRGKLRELFLLDGSTPPDLSGNVTLTGAVNTLPQDLRSELNALALTNPTHTVADIEAIVKQKGEDLFTLSKTRIRQVGAPYENKDGILYITRLVMRLVLRNHPVILASPVSVDALDKLFEFHSRGFAGISKADFSSYPATMKRVLISGFDPFDTGGTYGGTYYFSGGVDADGHLTNASGNIALALDGVILGNPGNQVVIRSAIFSTRWRDFDNNWVENFFTPFFTAPPGNINRPNMIITFSYGLHYGTFGAGYEDHDHDWHLDRFAANYRSGGADNAYEDTGASGSPLSPFPEESLKPVSTREYIESKLPYEKIGVSGKVQLTNRKIVINHGPFSELSIKNSQTAAPFSSGRSMKGETGTFSFVVKGKRNITGALTDITHLYDLSHLTVHSHFNMLQMQRTTKYRVVTGNYIGISHIPLAAVVAETDFSKPILMKHEDRKIRVTSSGAFHSLIETNTTIKLIMDNDLLKFRTSTDPLYIPLPTWTNYKDAALEGAGISDPLGYHDIYFEARSGSGGAYMSNEIHYRTSYLRETLSSTIPNGHVHVGFHVVDPGGGTGSVRNQMTADAKEMIRKFNDIP